MKKIALILGLGLSFNAGAVPTDNILEQLNAEIVNVLAPLQNHLTTAQLVFNSVETDEQHALNLALNSSYHKIGKYNTFEFKIDNLNYSYGDGSKPTTTFKGSIGINLTKLLSQDQINDIVPNAAEMLKTIVEDYYPSYYGDAASVNGIVTSTTRDANGNYDSLTGIVSARVDLAKLEDKDMIDSVMATEAVIYATINVKTGLTLNGYVVSNPLYSRFQDNEQGLKEVLDKLLAQDNEVLEEIGLFLSEVDMIAEQLVNIRNALQFHDHKITLTHNPKAEA